MFYQKIKFKRLFLIFFVALCVVDQYTLTNAVSAYSKKKSQKRVSLIEEKLIKNNYQKFDSFAYAPDEKTEDPLYIQLDAMLAAQTLNIKTINGYTATSPSGYAPFWVNHDYISLNTWLKSRDMTVLKNKILIIK